MPYEFTTRRELLRNIGIAAASATLGGMWAEADAQEKIVAAPSLPVALAHCETYDMPAVTAKLQTLLDQTGGAKRLASGKTIAIKVNLTGSPMNRFGNLPASRSFHIHPNVALALATLLDKAGAKRIRFVEGTYSTQPMEKTLQNLGWDLAAFAALHAPVEFEDTRHRGPKPYTLVKVPGGGDLFPAYQLNHSYADCDTYISLAKLKNHATAGVTLSMKNNFGITPTALYGQHDPNENSTSARIDIFHQGKDKPAAGLPQEVDPNGPRVPSYRVPRHTVDAIRIRPIDFALIDGIETVSGGEGPWLPELAALQPHLLIAGRNPVCTDAIATVCMGYDPQAASASGPFPGDNHLALAAKRGLGTNDPKRIEVIGLTVAQARHPFKWEPKQRHT